jgi:hypothetical protein
MAQTTFQPIKINPPTAKDKQKITKDQHTNKHTVPFPLSARPPVEWLTLFDGACHSRFLALGAQRPQVKIQEAELIVICEIEQLPGYFPIIKENIETANRQYLTLLEQRAKRVEDEKRRQEEAKVTEKRTIDEVLGKLDFS